MRESKNIRLRHVATPTIALLLAAALPGCGTGSCNTKKYATEESVRGDVDVDDVSEWIGDDGELVGDCTALCRMAGANDDGISEPKCTIHSVSSPDPEQDAAASQGGAGGGEASDKTRLDVSCDYKGYHYCEGRRHACWQQAPQGRGFDAIGAWLARAASAEAGSVHSFHQLVRELQRFDAPNALIEEAKHAMRDEVKHARMMTRLAADWGGRADPVEISPFKERSLFELAIENATEGCTKETFAALVALHQASHAQDASIAACMARIGNDETRHGQLAWDLHAWFLTRFTPEEAQRVNEALASSLAELAELAVQDQMTAEQRAVLGLPRAQHLPALAKQLSELLTPYSTAA